MAAILETGQDPSAVAKRVKEEDRTAPTVASVIDLYMDKWARPRKRSWAEDERLLRREVLPSFGHRKLKSLRRRDVVALLDEICERGAPVVANRTLAVFRRLCNFALERDILETSPCLQVKNPAPEVARTRVLSESEIARFLSVLPALPLASSTRSALLALLLTGQRSGEVLRATWDDVDLEQGTWTIPSVKAKNKRAHSVPLTPVVQALFKAQRELHGTEGCVFGSPNGGGAMTPTVLSTAIRRNLEAFGFDERFTPHDITRTVATNVASFGVPRQVVEALLNHAPPRVASIYDRYSYGKEKSDALQKWEAYLGTLGLAENMSDLTVPQGA